MIPPDLAQPQPGGSGASSAPLPPIRPTEDLNVVGIASMTSPAQIKAELPMTPAANRTVVESRDTFKAILAGMDRRLLVIVGPCSIHDEQAALEYAQRLRDLRAKVERLVLVMRVYFEKPRTTTGWKGLVNDPHLDGSLDIETGMRRARKLLLAITQSGVPAATEFLDPITPQYFGDLVSWAAIGARTTESQTHRQMASGLSMPVGYKNNTDGNLQVALDAMQSAGSPHSFLGIDEQGRTAVVRTRGNKWGHLILRGGRLHSNYEPLAIADAVERLRKAHLPTCIMVDCSHANAGKKFAKQEEVWRSVIAQRVAGNVNLIGPMLESHLFEGSQPMAPADKLRYGVSVTDECIGWEKTAELLLYGDAALRG